MPNWFLSYNSKDAALTESLEGWLRELLPDAGFFYARKSLRAGGYWLPRLSDEIRDADAFVLLVGESGLGPWQVLEYYEALDRRAKEPAFPLLFVLMEGQTAPGLPFLRQLHWLVVADPGARSTAAQLVEAAAHGASVSRDLWRYTAPYRGLLAMAEADSDYFFGRGAETVQILEGMAAAPDRLPVLLGNSGVGKSSLAQAGVLAALKRQAWPEGAAAPDWPARFAGSRRWCTLHLQPGAEPLKALVEPFLRTWRMDVTDPLWGRRQAEWVAAMLDGKLGLRDLLDATERRYDELGEARPPAYLLYIDQGEELYVRSQAAQRSRFSAVVAEALGDTRLFALMSLRSDFLGALQADEALYGVHRQVNVTPLREAALVEVITRPAALLSARFENASLPADIARRTMEESARDAGALPLLSYLLDDMWTQMVARGDGMLRLPAQAVELGGVLAQRADAFAALNAGAVATLRRILTLKLATVREDGEPTRRRAARSEFTEQEWALVGELCNHPHRLLVTAAPEGGEAYAEVAHEAIFRRWGKLQEWIAGQREFLAWKATLEARRREWQVLPEAEREDALLRGGALVQAEGWLANRPDDLGGDDRAFILGSIAAEHALRARAERERRERERLQQRLLWSSLAALVLLAVLGGALAWEWREAEGQRDEARQQQAFASSQAVRAERSLSFALDATDHLALQVVQELEQNFDVPTKDKIFLAARMEAEFTELATRVGGTGDLRSRQVALLTSVASMLVNVGRFDLAADRVAQVEALIANAPAGEPRLLLPPAVGARTRIAAGQVQMSRMAFAQADKEFQAAVEVLGKAGDDGELRLARARLAAARARSAAAANHWLAAAPLAEEAEALTQRGLSQAPAASGASAALRRSFHLVLLDMDRLRITGHALQRTGGDVAAVAKYRRDVEQAKPSFRGGMDPAWRFHEAALFQFEANVAESSGRIAAAIDSVTKAIDALNELVTGDYGNLDWRSALAGRLIDRAGFAVARSDFRQAEVDIIGARTLTASIRRDSSGLWLSSLLDVLADFQLGRLHLARVKLDEAAAVLTRMQRRVGFYRTVFVEPDRLDDYEFWAHLGLVPVYRAKKQDDEARREGRSAMGLAAGSEARQGETPFSTMRRLDAYSALADVDAADAPAADAAEASRLALAASERMVAWFPASPAWHWDRAFHIGREAIALLDAGRKPEAAAALALAMSVGKAGLLLAPGNLQLVRNVTFYAFERSKLLAAANDWNGIAEVAATMRALVPEGGGSAGDLGEFMPTWTQFASFLAKAALDAAEEKPPGSHPGAAALRREAAMAAAVGRRLAERSAQASAAPAAVGTLDPGSLDLSGVKTGIRNNTMQVSRRLGFAAPSSYPAVWETLSGAELAEAVTMLAQTTPYIGAASKRPIERVRRTTLPFYADGTLFEAEYTDADGTVLTTTLLVVNGGNYYLDGRSPPIHEANKVGPLRIRSKADAIAYLRFFCAFLIGNTESGSFQIVEAVQEIAWASNASLDTKAAVGRLLRPLVVWPDPDQPGSWRSSATVAYQDAIFHARFVLRPTGMVEMLEDMPVAASQPMEPPLITAAGRTNRVVQRLDLASLGERAVLDEVAALQALAARTGPGRLAHHEQLAREAQALQGPAAPARQ